jgi:uncharacterized protein (TIGR03032 family)
MTVTQKQSPNATPIACNPDAGFVQWLATTGGSLAVSTYQAGKLLLIGWDGRQLTLLMRNYDKPMGIDVADSRLVVATRNSVTVHADDPLLAHDYLEPGRYDALYLPRVTWHTADLNIHDIAFGDDGLWFANTRFSCLAQLSDTHSFVPRWQPPFVTEIAPEDRCHLNGMAMADGKPAYVTCLGVSDTPGGWRENKATGGILMDVASNEVVLDGLCMPHSPRLYRDRLWVLNSGEGKLLRVDPEHGTAEVVCDLPAYLRGLTFVGDHALIGLCKIRQTNVFGGMPVQARHEKLLCGVAVVNVISGERVGVFEFTGGCEEIFDVRFLSGIRKPSILNPERPETLEAVNAPAFSYWLREKNLVEDFR